MELCQNMRQSVCAYLIVLCIAISDAGVSERNNMGTNEYCYRDVFFEPRCDTTEVILLKSAVYGRMRKERCIIDDLGSIGCAVDALAFLDSQCSGRRSCQVIIPQLDQQLTSTCPTGMEKYLEVEYDCVEVAYPSRGYCESNGPTDIGNQHGYLSNLVAKETGCGSTDSPWRITAQPGQQFQIRLWSFNYATPETYSGCDTYALINEAKQTASHTMCAEAKRESPLFTSIANEVELRLVNNGHQDRYIIVEYEAFGCTNREPPENGWIRRLGDRLSLGCNATSEHVQQWQLKCNGTHWVGDEHECTAIVVTNTPSILPEISKTQRPTHNYGSIGIESTMSILVITGLAVLVCLCIILSCMAVYIVRYRRRERSAPDHDNDCDYNSHNRRPHIATRQSPAQNNVEPGNAIETDDYWTWQKNQRGPLVHNVVDNTRSLPGTIATRASHQCCVPEESTLLVRKPEDRQNRFGTGRKAADYDKLDPNFIEDSGVNQKSDYTT